jgi:hypothetical protein
MKRIWLSIDRQFTRLEKLGKWSFFWRAWLQATAIAFLMGNVCQLLFPAGPRSDLEGLGVLHLIALVAVIGPIFETLVFQFLPLEIASALGFRRWIRMAISIVPFALMHSFAGVPTVVAAGAVGGFYFAFTYERWKKQSLLAGVVMPFLLHSSYNLVGLLALIALQP